MVPFIFFMMMTEKETKIRMLTKQMLNYSTTKADDFKLFCTKHCYTQVQNSSTSNYKKWHTKMTTTSTLINNTMPK